MINNRNNKRDRDPIDENSLEREEQASTGQAILSSTFHHLAPLISGVLSPKKAQVLNAINKQTKQAVTHSEAAKIHFAKHFPHLLDACLLAGITDWHKAFRDATNHQYQNNDRLCRLFYATKQSKLEDLIRLHLTYDDLLALDSSNIPLASWARKTGNQAVCNYFYRVVIAHFLRIANNKPITSAHQDQHGNNLLHWAVQLIQSLELIENMLSQKGYDINRTNSAGLTALHLSIHQDRTDYTALLLKHKANVECRDAHDETPLSYAVRQKAPNTVRLLLDHKAMVDAKCGILENTALTTAAANGALECMTVLLDPTYKADVNGVAIDRTALFIAAMNGHTNCVTYLLTHAGQKADPSILTDLNETPVFIAAQNGHVDVIRAIMTHSRMHPSKLSNTCTLLGKSPLLAAAAHGHDECMGLLIAYRANPDLFLPDIDATALMLAAEDDANDALALLIKHGANVNIISKGDKATALHMATLADNLGAVKTLLMAGANHQLEMTLPAEVLIELYKSNNRDFLPTLIERLNAYPGKTQWSAEELAKLLEMNDTHKILHDHRLSVEQHEQVRFRK